MPFRLSIFLIKCSFQQCFRFSPNTGQPAENILLIFFFSTAAEVQPGFQILPTTTRRAGVSKKTWICLREHVPHAIEHRQAELPCSLACMLVSYFLFHLFFYPFLWRRGVKLFVRWLVSTLLKIDGTSKKNLDSDQSQGLKM